MGVRKQPGTKARDHRIEIYVSPEEWADLSVLPRYKRCKFIREALREAGLTGRSSQQARTPSIAA